MEEQDRGFPGLPGGGRPDRDGGEAHRPDQAGLSIDCTAVENEVANSMYQRSELDWLIYNDPLAYAELILNGDIANYLKSASYMNDKS